MYVAVYLFSSLSCKLCPDINKKSSKKPLNKQTSQ